MLNQVITVFSAFLLVVGIVLLVDTFMQLKDKKNGNGKENED